MKTQGLRTLICIPTYNEIENIGLIVPAVLRSLPGGEVLVIDDNSPDGTGDRADELAAADSRVHVLHRLKKEGLGRAYMAGFEWGIKAGFDNLIEFDADFSHNPEYLPVIEKELEANELVIGSRRVKGGGVRNWGLARKAISSGGSLYAQLVLGSKIKDFTGGLNGIKASTLKLIDYKKIIASGFLFQIELKYRCQQKNIKIKEIPIIFVDRVRGKSKMSGRIFAEAPLSVWKLRLNRLF
jgi:dolichol-phosphate mannosyltransferase